MFRRERSEGPPVLTASPSASDCAPASAVRNTTSASQPVAISLFWLVKWCPRQDSEVRQTEATIAKLVGQLVPDPDAGAPPKSVQHQRAAYSRWQRSG
jgi:hypothetical protein